MLSVRHSGTYVPVPSVANFGTSWYQLWLFRWFSEVIRITDLRK